MNSRSTHFLLAAVTLFSSSIFISNGSARAHSFDYCIEVLQEEAEIIDTGTSKFKLQQKYPKEYKAFLQECDQELQGNGLLTIKQVRDQRNNRRNAKLVRQGLLDQDGLDQKKVGQRQVDVGQREARLRRLREQICANPTLVQKYACPKKPKITPWSAAPNADNMLVAAALQFGKRITQTLVDVIPVGNTQAAVPQTDRNIPAKPTSLDKPSGILVAQASSVGQWSPPIKWPLVVIHAALGPNGKVLAWTRPKMAPPGPKYILWNPVDNSFSSVPKIKTDIFCAGHAFAPNGNLLLAGGHASDVAGDGSKDINIYDFNTNSWLSYPNKMNAGRWYSTVTYNANGEGVIVGGSVTNEGDLNPVPQVWGSGTNLRTLNGTSLGLPVKPYVWNFVDPSGRIFNAGPTRTTRALSTTGKGRWSPISNNNFGNRYYGSAVMYDPSKVIVIGGSNGFYGPPTKSTEVIDLSTSNAWIPVDEMQFARRHHTATLLADGKVFVSGGTSLGSFNNTNGRILAAEIWDPVTTQWTTVARMSVTRSYHQTALLLPDARVLIAGGGLPAGNSGPDSQGNFNAEIYSPPYLFKGARPTIASAPTNVSYGENFNVETPNAESISKVHWIKLSSFTHQFDMNQRINYLAFQSKGSSSLNIAAPLSKTLCPPGHYMLFVLNSQGVPSVAKIIKIS